ncbi:AAA family ATPase [Sphingomicrobium sp. XHP0239]|uniref:AAA family ATPase n=1 Tax=Sphingomicrobium maritimum TaxID=3133972 RepID=UPI0031CCC737
MSEATASINFPKISSLVVCDYHLYPGEVDGEGLKISFDDGPWLILGVNGLGKSTLLLLMRMMISGNVRLRPAGFAGQRNDLQVANKRMFAVRVADAAADAVATITCKVGEDQFTVTRDLADLSLIEASRLKNGNAEAFTDEGSYQFALAESVGVGSFDDVVRVLEYLTFVLESQTSLIWNVEAQYEVFRGLLVPKLAPQLRELEQEIISADSSARNLGAVLHKMRKSQEKKLKNLKNANNTRAKLRAERASLENVEARLSEISEELEQLKDERDNIRLQLKRSEADLLNQTAKYEKLKFESIRQAFAGLDLSLQYIYLKLFSDGFCLACGHEAKAQADKIEKRVKAGKCPVCANVKSLPDNGLDLGEEWRSQVSDAHKGIEKAEGALDVHRSNFANLSGQVHKLEAETEKYKDAQEKSLTKIRRLVRQLPADDKERMREEENRIDALIRQVEEFKSERAEAESRIAILLDEVSAAVETIRVQIEKVFDETAAPFFAEKVRLVYSPRNVKIGQTGRKLSFPAFETELTSGATLGQYIRRTEDQVSYSQRLYLDIIFRMALLTVIGGDGATLVVDGPEGSVDAIFAERAGALFASFAALDENNIILACNIVEGGLIPKLLSNYKKGEKWQRIVNLIDQAKPTAALDSLKPEYMEKLHEIISDA